MAVRKTFLVLFCRVINIGTINTFPSCFNITYYERLIAFNNHAKAFGRYLCA